MRRAILVVSRYL